MKDCFISNELRANVRASRGILFLNIMNKEQEQFHNAFAKQGGIFDIQEIAEFHQLKDIISGLFDYIKIKYPLLPSINFDFILNDTFNASVTKDSNQYYIGINIGAYFLIRDMFYKMLATQSVLNNIGDCSIETKEKKEINWIAGKYGVEFNITNSNLFVQPLSADRLDYANSLIQNALTFLILHECGHIVRGHLGYVNSNMWTELDYTQANRQPIFNSQTLEMDADSFATNWCIIIANTLISNKFRPSKHEPNIFENWENFSFHWAFSIYSLLRLQGFNEIDKEKYKTYTHPPTNIRMFLILGNVMSIFLELYKDIAPMPISKSILSAAKEAENAFEKISYYENNFTKFTEVYKDPFLKNYLTEITDHWNNVKHLLEPFAYGELPPLKNS